MDGEIHTTALGLEQTIQARSYDCTIKPEMSVRSKAELSKDTLTLALHPWPKSSVQPRTDAVGIVMNYYPFGLREHGHSWFSVKHNKDGTIAAYRDDDLIPL